MNDDVDGDSGVKFWENQESVLKGWKEFADGSFPGKRASGAELSTHVAIKAVEPKADMLVATLGGPTMVVRIGAMR